MRSLCEEVSFLDYEFLPNDMIRKQLPLLLRSILKSLSLIHLVLGSNLEHLPEIVIPECPLPSA